MSLAASACGGSGLIPVGRAAKGDSMIVEIERTNRVSEIRYKGAAGEPVSGGTIGLQVLRVERVPEIAYDLSDLHQLLRPLAKDNELAAVKIRVFLTGDLAQEVTGDSRDSLITHSTEATTADGQGVLIGVPEAAVLRIRDSQQTYPSLVISGDNARDVTILPEPHPDENLYTPFFSGPVRLPPRIGREGWVFFEIPKAAKVKDIRLEAWGDELYATGPQHYVVAPSSEENELVIMRLEVHNEDATRMIMTVDEKTGELRGFGLDEKYALLDVTSNNPENVTIVDSSHPSENRYLPLLSGPFELPKGFSVIGWVAWEVPKGTKVRELRWEAGGDVVFIR